MAEPQSAAERREARRNLALYLVVLGVSLVVLRLLSGQWFPPGGWVLLAIVVFAVRAFQRRRQ